MNKHFFKTIPFLIFIIIIASCNKNDKTALKIPNDAAVVFHINTSSLSSKLSWKEIQSSDWFQKIYKQNDDSLAKQLMDDPEKSGIDSKSDLIYFIKKRNRGGYMVFEGKIKDAAAFEAFNKKISNNAAVVKDGAFNLMTIKERGLIAWNDKEFAYVYDNPFMNMTPGDEKNNFNGLDVKTNIDSLKMYGKSVFDLPSSKSMSGDKRFKELLDEKGDFHIWVNTGQLYSGGPSDAYMSMMRVNAVLEDNAQGITINFDDGKITGKSKQYFGKQMRDLINKYKAKPVDAALINRLPSNPVAVFALNFPPESVMEFLKLIGLDGVANSFLSKSNYSVEDFVKGNKGQVLFAVTDIRSGMDSSSKMESDRKPGEGMHFILANAVANKGSFDKLLNLIAGDTAGLRMRMPALTYKVEGDWFVASNSPQNISTFLGGSNNNVPFASRISGHPVGIYVDFQKIITSISSPNSTKSAEATKASLETWQDLVITGGDYNDGAIEMNGEVNLVNKTENSLKQLNNYLNRMSLIYPDKMNFERHGIDSVHFPKIDTNKKAF